jgi:hypothetical protein
MEELVDLLVVKKKALQGVIEWGKQRYTATDQECYNRNRSKIIQNQLAKAKAIPS